MSKPSPRLGRGLSSLIPPREKRLLLELRSAAEVERGQVQEIPVDQIRPNPRQPRRAFDAVGIANLAASIRSTGLLQPVLVRPLPDDAGYELLAGERRWRAAREAGLERIPAIIRPSSDSESFEIALVENLQREDLNPIERASAYRQYVDTFSVNVEDLAIRLGESRSNVCNYLRLLDLQQEIQELVIEGRLAMGHARAIAGVSDPQRQLSLAKLAVRRNLSVRQVETLANAVPATGARAAGQPRAWARQVSTVEEALSGSLGLEVKVVPGRKKNSGRVVIAYGSLEEFDRIAQRICGRSALD